jgi:hypothetical protein
MENTPARFYDLRFGVLIMIIIMILAFKYFAGQSQDTASMQTGQPAATQPQQSSSVTAPHAAPAPADSGMSR